MLNIENLKLEDIEYSDIRSEYETYLADASTFRTEMADDESFYLGNQYTIAQETYLKSIGQPPEANNKVKPAVEQVLANVAASSPEWNVTLTRKTDNTYGQIWNKLLDDIWYDSNGDTQFRQCAKDYIIKGLAFGYIYPDWSADDGLGALRFKRIKPESVYVPKATSTPDFSNAASIIISDLNDKESLVSEFPQFEDKIGDAVTDNNNDEKSSGNYSADNIKTRGDEGADAKEKVRKYIRFSMVSVPYALIEDIITGHTSEYDYKAYKLLLEDENYNTAVKEGIIHEKIIYKRRCREIFYIGDNLCYDTVLPISKYPIIAACNEFTGTPYPSGDVRQAKSPQRMLNRTQILIINHSTSATSNKVLYEEGAIEPGELAKWNIPNAAIKVTPGSLSSKKIVPLGPTSISSELFMEKARYEIDIEQKFGAYKMQQGNPAGAVDTVGEAQIIDEAVARKQNWKMLPLYDMLTALGRIAVQWIPHVYSQQRIIHITDGYGERKEIILNQPVESNGDIERIFSLHDADVSVKVVIGSTRAKSPMARLQKDLALLNAGIYDKQEVIMNLEGDVDKMSLLQRHGEIAQLSAMVQQLQEQVKKLSGDMQTREREIFHSNMRAEIAEATKPVAQAVANIRAKEKIESAKQVQKTLNATEDLANVVTSNKRALEGDTPNIGAP